MRLEIIEALKSTTPFQRMSDVVLCALADEAVRAGPLTVPPHGRFARAGDPCDPFYVVLSGRVSARDEAGKLVASHGPMAVLGAVQALGGGRWGENLEAQGPRPATLARIPARALRETIQSSVACCGALEQLRVEQPMDCGTEQPDMAEVVVFRSGGKGPSGPLLGGLLECTALAMAQDSERWQSNDRLLLVRVMREGHEGDIRRSNLDRVCTTREKLVLHLTLWRKAYHYIFVDVYDLAPHGDADFLEPVWPKTLAWINTPPAPSGPRRESCSIEATPGIGRDLHVEIRAPAAPLTSWSAVHSVMRGVHERLQPKPVAELPAREQTRAVVDLAALRELMRGVPAPCSRLPLQPAIPSMEGFSRIGRCVSQRLLGLALGGGGVLGFAHIPLIKHILKAGLPIDLVAGTSFGAVVAAYYCASPGASAPGLQLLCEEARSLGWFITVCLATNVPARLFFDASLGGATIEAMPLPFYPVAADIAAQKIVVMERGSAGSAISASGGAPGMFVPTILYDSSGNPVNRLVDGSVLQWVPAECAAAQGAGLVVSSSVIPRLDFYMERGPLFGSWLGRQLYAFNPLFRQIDIVRSLYAAAHMLSQRSAMPCGSNTVVFQFMTSDPMKYLFFDFGQASKVMADAEFHIVKDGVIKGIKEAWLALHPRRALSGGARAGAGALQ